MIAGAGRLDRRAFLRFGAAGAAWAASRGLRADDGKFSTATKNIRSESAEQLARKRAALLSLKELGPTITDFEIRQSKGLRGKKAAFFIDDVIFVFRDLARDRPASCWDHFFLKALKETHEKYGLKVQLNLFFRMDFYYGARGAEFTLRDVPDIWKQEFQAAKDWLRFGLHSYAEFPDYPWINASYDDVKFTWDAITREVERFAGEGMFARAVVPHWGPVSKEGCRALRDCGAKALWVSDGRRFAYAGDRGMLPYGHAGRIETDRKDETALYWRSEEGDDICISACGYNHLTTEQLDITRGTFKWLHDRATDCNFMYFGDDAPLLNLFRIEDIPERLSRVTDYEFLVHATHEQYSFPGYFAYQPDSREKLLLAAKTVREAGYDYVFIEDKIDC